MNLRIEPSLSRTGLKGPAAVQLLERLGVPLPPAANQFLVSELPGQGTLRVLRLGHTEFLLEQQGADTVIESVIAAAPGTRAHLAPRCDFSVLLRGESVFRALSGFCAFDFAELEREPAKVVMTLMAGTSVMFILEPDVENQLALRLWCDPGFATYLTHCLSHPGENR